jgi:hypothetical protein
VLVDRVQYQDLVERLARWPAFHRPNRATDGDVDSQTAQGFPQLLATGRGDRQIEEFLTHGPGPFQGRVSAVGDLGGYRRHGTVGVGQLAHRRRIADQGGDQVTPVECGSGPPQPSSFVRQ